MERCLEGTGFLSIRAFHWTGFAGPARWRKSVWPLSRVVIPGEPLESSSFRSWAISHTSCTGWQPWVELRGTATAVGPPAQYSHIGGAASSVPPESAPASGHRWSSARGTGKRNRRSLTGRRRDAHGPVEIKDWPNAGLTWPCGADRNRTDDLLLAKQHRLSAGLHAVFAGHKGAKDAKLGAHKRFRLR
jgi:hypothetical protein